MKFYLVKLINRFLVTTKQIKAPHKVRVQYTRQERLASDRVTRLQLGGQLSKN
jgi:hypothetical protein